MLNGIRRGARFAFQNTLIRFRDDYAVMLEVDPQDIGFVQFPELWTTRPDKRRSLQVRRLAGDWDSVDSRSNVFWSGMYEADGEPSRMIPIERFGFYRACVEHFGNGVSWQSTEWHQWLLGRIAAGERVKRYETLEEIRARLELLDRMHSAIARHGYESAIDRPVKDRNRMSRFLRQPWQWEEPVINLGRNGRVAIEDGRHRLCLARIAGSPRVRVRIGMIHRDLPASRLHGLSATPRTAAEAHES